MTDRTLPGHERSRPGGLALVVSVLAVVVLCVTAAPAAAGVAGTAGTPTADLGSAGGHADGPLAQQGEGGDRLTVCDRNVTGFTDAFNTGTEQVPAFVRARVSDSTVHLAIKGEGGGDFTLVTDDESQVTDSTAGEPDSPSVRVVVQDCQTFRNLTDSRDPGSQFRTAYANNRVRFVGVGGVNWLFFTALDTATDPISLGVVLFIFLVLLVVAYLIVRRATSKVRGGRVDNRGDEGDGGGGGGAGGSGGGGSGGGGGGGAGGSGGER